MSKKIVVIERCKDCNNSHNSFSMMNGNTPMGILSGGAILACSKTLDLCPSEGIPDWCPLPKAPGPMVDVVFEPDCLLDEFSYMAGWNDCVDALGGCKK